VIFGRLTVVLCSGASLSVIAAASPANAQVEATPRAGAQIEEITLTARRHEEDVQKVPIAISAVGGQQLEQQGVQNGQDLTRLVPALTTNRPRATKKASRSAASPIAWTRRRHIVRRSAPTVSGEGSDVTQRDDGPVVETTAGTVEGIRSNGICGFKGIPYGASTAGAGRFSPPQPRAAWSGVFEATAFGAPSPQLGGMVSFSPDDTIASPSEDCLTLSVWTPATDHSRKRPVMVWLHGGGFDFGAGGIPAYDGANLARNGDVVVVTVNHRLNIFGHLYLGDLGGERYAHSGNAGMLDIVAALRWVRDNIAGFGGDPGNVTLFGQSGGAGKVNAILAIAGAEGLVHKAIVQSGSVLWALPRERATEIARRALDHLGLGTSDLDKLHSLPLATLQEAAQAAANFARRPGYLVNIAFGPVIDGISIPHHPWEPAAPEGARDIPMMIGTCTDETALFLPNAGTPAFDLLKPTFGGGLADAELHELIAEYRRSTPEASEFDIVVRVSTDRFYRANAIVQAERKLDQGPAPVYMYAFAWTSPAPSTGAPRAPHGIDLPFIFDNLSAGLFETGPIEDRKAFAATVSRAWAAFAWTGEPTAPGLPPWPRYTQAQRPTMVLDYPQSQVVDDPRPEERIAATRAPPWIP
jgi:para-nitrobenzyl esterase